MTWVFYDGAVVLIILTAVLRGYRRGVLRTALGIVCIALSCIIAGAASSYTVSRGIYEAFLRQTVYEHIENAVDKAKEETAAAIKEKAESAADSFIDENLDGSPQAKDAVDRILEGGRELLEGAAPEIYSFFDDNRETLLTNPVIYGKIEDVVSACSGRATEEINKRLPFGVTVTPEAVEKAMTEDGAVDAFIYELFGSGEGQDSEKGVARYIESKAAAPVFIRLISAVLWAVVFAVSGFVLRIIVRVLLTVRKIGPVKVCDSALGGVLGAAAGCVVVLICTGIIFLLVNATGGMTYANENIFGETHIFGMIYDIISARFSASA